LGINLQNNKNYTIWSFTSYRKTEPPRTFLLKTF